MNFWDFLKNNRKVLVVIAILIAAITILPFLVFNVWLAWGSIWLGLMVSIVLGIILIGTVVIAGIGTIKPGAKGEDFIEAFKKSLALKVTLALVGYLTFIRLWWAIVVSWITSSFTTVNYGLAIVVAGIVLMLLTVVLGGILSHFFSDGKNRRPLWAMVAVGSIATLVAFTADRPQGEFFDPYHGTAIAKHCPNKDCPNPDSSRLFMGKQSKYRQCPYCNKELADATSENVKVYLDEVKEKKGRLYLPESLFSWWDHSKPVVFSRSATGVPSTPATPSPSVAPAPPAVTAPIEPTAVVVDSQTKTFKVTADKPSPWIMIPLGQYCEIKPLGNIEIVFSNGTRIKDGPEVVNPYMDMPQSPKFRLFLDQEEATEVLVFSRPK